MGSLFSTEGCSLGKIEGGKLPRLPDIAKSDRPESIQDMDDKLSIRLAIFMTILVASVFLTLFYLCWDQDVERPICKEIDRWSRVRN